VTESVNTSQPVARFKSSSNSDYGSFSNFSQELLFAGAQTAPYTLPHPHQHPPAL
jgi:hypothetical protein